MKDLFLQNQKETVLHFIITVKKENNNKLYNKLEKK